MGFPFSATRLSMLLAGLWLGLAALPANAAELPEIQQLIRQSQYDKALDEANGYISAKPKDPQGRFLKGVILTELKRTNDAITVFQKLTEEFPELPEPYNNLAVLYAQQKQYDKARTALEMAIRTHPSYSTAHENLGDLYAKLASQAYDKALQLDSGNATTQTKLALIREMFSKSGRTGVKPSAPAATAPTTPSAPAAQPTVVAAAAPTPVTPATQTTSNGAKLTPPTPTVVSTAPASNANTANAAKTAIPTVTTKPGAASTTTTSTATTVATGPASNSPAPTKPAAKADNEELLVSKALQSWAAAWSRKDVKAYLGHYASDFTPPGGMNRKAWEAERTARIDKPGKIEVDVSDIKVSIAGDKATVRFRQNYKSASLKSSAGKTLIFIRSGNRWLIQQEKIG
jgi:ketosteroid isomerase-like protein